MSKLLVINADDLGISLGTNQAIEKAYQKGILTSASLMPTGPAFPEAIKMVKRHPRLGIGIHLSLNWGKSILTKEKIPELIDQDGYFYPNVPLLFSKAIGRKKVLGQIKDEFNAQIQVVKKAGIKPDHLDSQFHVHFFPTIFPLVCQLAQKYQIKFIRVPIEPLFSFPFSQNLFKWSLLQFFGWIINHQGHLPPNYPRFYGILYSSKMTGKIFEKILANSQSGITEIALHPGFYDLGKTKFDFQRQEINAFLKSKSRLLELRTLINQDKKILTKKYQLCFTTFTQTGNLK